MQKSTGEFIALFDADYVPPADFLKKMIPQLYLDDRVAFAQSRWSYLDGQFSWIAKAMSLAIDVYAFVDQRARYVGNLLAHFSGTCGVFRRKAIEDAGGWSADTLAEDLDLSIRLHLKGWKYIYVPTVVCPGEIPPSFDNLRHQQYRWAKGYSECLRKHGGAILTKCSAELLSKNGGYPAPLNIFHLSAYHYRNRGRTIVLLGLSTIVLAHGILEISSCTHHLLTLLGDLQRAACGFKCHSLRILSGRSNETETDSPPWIFGGDTSTDCFSAIHVR